MRYDIVVVGAGPAGMTAALYGARAGKRVLLIEALFPGGQILASQKIENYPALPETDGYTFAENLKGQVLAAGAELVSGRVSSIEAREGGFLLSAENGVYEGRAVVLATGLEHRKLGLHGEDTLIGRGISFCATCDGMFYRGREVAVLGGGNTAVQDALVLSDFCTRVYLIHRRASLRAERELAERLQKKKNIVFLGDTVIEAVHGETTLDSLTLCNTATGERRELAVAGLFEAIGQIPQNEAFRSLVDLDENGYFITDGSGACSRAGIFAAGDACRKEIRQLTTAVSDGTVAALSAAAYVDTLDKKE